MPDFFFFINEVLWGSIMIYLLLGAGIWFTQWVYPVSLYSQVWQKSEKQRYAPAGRINVVPGTLYQPGGTPRQRESGGRCAGHQRRRARRGLLDVGDGATRNGHLLCRKFARPAV